MVVSQVVLLWLAGCSDSVTNESWEGPESAPAAQFERFNVGCDANPRGTLLSVEWVASYSKGRLKHYWDTWLNGLSALGYIDDTVDPDVDNGTDNFIVTYCTIDADGSPIEGTGMLGIPRTFWTAPTVMYGHGTSVTRTDTPTNPNVDEVFDGPTPMVIFAGHNYIYLAPDLTGFGGSTADRHRYFHAATSAANELDMLRAMDGYWLYDLKANGTLFNFGFSQGGQTALAFAEAAEADGYEITGTATVGAVAAPEPWFDGLLDVVDASYLNLYVADVVVNYELIYGDVYGTAADTFQAPYDATVEGLFDMTHSFVDVVDGVPGSAAELMTPDFYAEAQDPGSPLRLHLQENAVDDVILDHPIQMYHSVGDDEVAFELAEASRDALAVNNDVTLVEWPELDHLNTWHEVLPVARDWFDSL